MKWQAHIYLRGFRRVKRACACVPPPRSPRCCSRKTMSRPTACGGGGDGASARVRVHVAIHYHGAGGAPTIMANCHDTTPLRVAACPRESCPVTYHGDCTRKPWLHQLPISNEIYNVASLDLRSSLGIAAYKTTGYRLWPAVTPDTKEHPVTT